MTIYCPKGQHYYENVSIEICKTKDILHCNERIATRKNIIPAIRNAKFVDFIVIFNLHSAILLIGLMFNEFSKFRASSPTKQGIFLSFLLIKN